MNKIIGIYIITNTVTGDFYIGSSKNVKKRWKDHKCKSRWNDNPNNPMYQDMQKYGTDKFIFEILEEVEEVEVVSLKEKEQQFIEKLKPTYNQMNAKGWDVERIKETKKEYQKSDKRKKYKKQYDNQYNNQLCCYNGQTLTLQALRMRFWRKGIDHPTLEAKKYLI